MAYLSFNAVVTEARSWAVKNHLCKADWLWAISTMPPIDIESALLDYSRAKSDHTFANDWLSEWLVAWLPEIDRETNSFFG